MLGPVRVSIHYDERLRPSGRSPESREMRNAYDTELARLIPHILAVVQNRLNDIEADAASRIKTEDLILDRNAYASPDRQAGTLFVEIRLSRAGTHRKFSQALRTKIAGDILGWLGYNPLTATCLEVNLVFEETSGVRVLFYGRKLQASWGEDAEPRIGTQIPSM